MSDPQAVRAALGFQTQLQGADAESILAMSRRWSAVEANLSATIDALADEIAALSEAGEAVPAWKLYEMERYQSLLGQIAGEVNNFTSWAIVQMQDDAAKAQVMARQHAAEMMSITGGREGRSLGASFERLGKDAAEKIAGLAQGGQPLDKILSSAYPTAVNAITNKLITGAALGWNPRKTAFEALRGGGLDQALNHILLVSTDQQIRNYRQSQLDAYRSSGLVYGYKRICAKNERTCMACIALDGTIYPTSEVMQLHPRDRCSMIPLIVGRPVPQFETGLEWFKRQSPATQRGMLGPGKYKAWQDGLFDLEQLVTISPNRIWGDNAQVTSLKSLLVGGGGLGGVRRLSASDLLKLHQTAVPTSKAKTLDLGENTGLVNEIEKLLPSSKLPLKVKVGINDVLKAAKAGDSAYSYTDDDGRLAGAISWATKSDNQFYTEITGAGFVDAATNRKALLDVAEIAQAEGRGILANVPKDLTARYLDWGFTITKPGQNANTMQLGGDDIGDFIKSPEQFGAAKKVQVVEDMNKALADPEGTAVFRSGYELKGTGYTTTTLDPAEIPKLKKDNLPDQEPLKVPEGKHPAAGMILIDPKTGKLVLVNPAGGFGGAKTTIPKGTVEPGEDFQETAIREVFEETGFKAKIVGFLGDYEKTTSANRLYIGTIEDGAPWAGHFETEAVQLVPIEDARKFVDTGVDKQLLKDFEDLYQEAIAKGEGNLEKGLDLVTAEKQATQAALEDAQLDALADWAEGKSMTAESLKLALDYAKKTEPSLVPELQADLDGFDAAEKEARQQATAEAKKAEAIFIQYSNDGPDTLLALPTADLRAAITWAYENGENPRDIADLEAILATRAEQAQLKTAVPLPDDLQGATKAEKVACLVQETGATSWKLKQLTAVQINALFGQSKSDILDAAEQGAAKYYAAKQAKIEPQATRPEKGYVVLPPALHGATKAKLVDYLVQETGVTKWKINQLTKDEIDLLFGKTNEEILQAGEQGAAKYYAAKGQKQPQAETSADKAIRAGDTLTKDLASDTRAAAAWAGVPASRMQGVDVDALVGKTRREVLTAVDDQETEDLIDGVYFKWFGGKNETLAAVPLADLEAIDAYMSTQTSVDQVFVSAVKGAIQAKLAAKQTAVDQPEPVKFPEPTGKTANQYVEQLVKTGQFSADEILAQVQVTYPKTVFTLANVESKFSKFGITPPLAALNPADLEILKGHALHESLYLEKGVPLTSFDKAELEQMLAYVSTKSGTGWQKMQDFINHELVLKGLGDQQAIRTPSDIPQTRPTADLDKGKAIYEQMKAGQLPTSLIGGLGAVGLKDFKNLYAYADDAGLIPAHSQKSWAGPIAALESLTIPDPKKATKTFLANKIAEQLEDKGGVTYSSVINDLKKLKKDQLLAMLPTAEPGITQKPVTPKPPPTPPPPTPTPQAIKSGTLDVTGAKPDLVDDLKAKAANTWSGHALTGATKALDNIQAGSKGLVYTADDGSILGVMAFQNTGSTLKVSGAAFANPGINAKAVADALQEAQKLGIPLETWVPDAVQAQYAAWGFKNTSSKYYALSAADAHPDLLKQASQTITPQTDKGPIPLPPQAATMDGVKKLTKAQLVDHISLHGNIAKNKLNKLDKSDLVSLIGQQVGSKVDDLIAKKEEEEVLTAAFSKWQTGGNKAITTSKEGNKVLEYFQAKGVGNVPAADIDALRVHVEELREQERLASPFTPRFQPRPLPVLPDTAKLPQHDDFPADPGKLKVVRKLGGSTGAELVEDADGRQFVRKKGANPGHLREEVYADSIYQAAGLAVPRHQVYETSSGPVKLAEYVPGVPLNDFLKSASPNERTRVLNELRSGFAVDALLGNWDVLGLNQDNVVIGEDGKVYRIDNGGSLRYRAMGGTKPAIDWNGYATDIWSMREPGRGGAAENNARLFGDLSIYDISDQAKEVLTKRDEMLAAVPVEVREVLHRRFEYMRDLTEVSDTFRRDSFTADYADSFLRESTYIRQEGLIDALPKELKQSRKGSVTVKDENGRAFDNWRGSGSHMEAIGKYMKANGGNLNLITEWMARQAGDSWNDMPQAFKYHRALARGSLDDYFWRYGVGQAKSHYDQARKKYGPETFDKTMAIWHAFTYESLRNMDFPHNEEGGFVEIVRTENQSVVQSYGLRKSATDAQQIKRGAAESGSIYRGVTIFGSELTLQRVPWHRIHGFYFQGRGTANMGAFLGDGENEFVFDGAGLDVYYVGSPSDIEAAWNQVKNA